MKNKLFISLLLILETIFITIVVINFLFEKSTINNFALEQINKKASEKILDFNKYIKHQKDLVLSLANNKDLKKAILTKKNIEAVNNLFISFASAHKDIYQFRYIDNNGNEVVRVNNKNKAVLVKKENLQNKKNRYYFEDSFKKSKGEIYFSNIDLNMENGKIEKPIVPTIRVASPIVIDDIKYGIIIINVNLEEFLLSLEKAELYDINLVYDDGHIIFAKDKQYNWSRDFKYKNRIYNMYSFLEENFVSKDKNSKEYLLSKLSIETKNKVYLLIVPDHTKDLDTFYSYFKEKQLFLMFIALLIIPITYFILFYLIKALNKREKLERKAFENILLYSVMNSTDDLIFYKNKDFKYIGCNKAFEEFTGKTRSEIIDYDDFKIFDKETASLFRRMDIEMLEKGDRKINNEWVKYANGKKVLLQTKKMPLVYNEKNEMGIIGVSRDITEMHLAQQKIVEQSYYDGLTKVLNRKAFQLKINEKINLYKRYNTSFCIAMFDVDNFKEINDIYGHDVGDSVLINMSNFVKNTIRKTDYLYRVGGEEFIILLTHTSMEQALVVIEKIREHISQLDLIENNTRKITISIGLTEIMKNDDESTIYKRADELLYISKNNGKNKTSS